MQRGAVRWIAIAVIGALVAALGVGLVAGRGGDPAATGDAANPGPAAGPVDQAVEGPHLRLDLCAGVICDPMDPAAQESLLAEVEGDPRVASALLVSSDQAYQLFLDEFGDDEDLVASVRPQDMPARIEVELVDPAKVPEVLQDYVGHAGVSGGNDLRDLAR